MQWLIVLLSVVLLAACGGGDGEEDTDPHVCYVDGKPMDVKACR